MEYFYNSRLSFIPSYHRYLDFSSGRSDGTIRTGFVGLSLLPIPSVGDHRIGNYYFGTLQRSGSYPEDSVVLRSWVHLRSYAGNVQNARPFSVDSTISVVTSDNFSPATNINTSSLLHQVYADDTRPSPDGGRDDWIREPENSDHLNISEDLNRIRLKSESRASDKRKARRPQKGAIKGDPAFRGVAFQLELDQGKVRLRTYTGGVRRRCRQCHRDNVKAVLSSADSIPEIEIDVIKGTKSLYADNELGKKCSSCDTKKTPLWRDAEDGTPLCNACGIRYKKYRVRCVSCWFIPRKEGKANASCHRCGDPLRVAILRRSNSAQSSTM